MPDALMAAQQFATGPILDVHEHGSGNVNDTYLVTVDAMPSSFILQRINTRVFRRPEWIMLNIRTFSEHVQQRLRCETLASDRHWEVPSVLPTHNGHDFYVDGDGFFWRALSFIARSLCYQTVQSIDHARESGYALGRFHALVSDLDPGKLYDTLEGFHVAPQYLVHYQQVLAAPRVDSTTAEVRYGLRFVEQRQRWASVLEDARRKGTLAVRPIHGDPKVNNIMIDESTGRAISIVDLDTVKPGLVHYDIGDCLRSCCNALGEETTDLSQVRFDPDLCRAILQGYVSEARHFLSPMDYALMYDSIRLIAFELGLRFFTDHLEGNVYFKAKHSQHNLQRALVQWKLAESIESQEADIRAVIDELRSSRW
jgi:Ser/Thr protein kinase RdoA (MazF antagonist)